MRLFRLSGGRPILGLIVVGLLASLLPTPLLADEPAKAGVVTTLQGQATVSRPVIPRPIPLKFKDDVFTRDRIDTREGSIVRLLLGGKALITVRELSVFMWPPKQAPQVGVEMAAPASANTSSNPSFSAWFQIQVLAGITIRRVPAWTFLPRRIRAAIRRSSSLALVQEPMKT